EDLAAVRSVNQSLNLPLLDDSARHLQKLVAATTYPGRPAASSASLSTDAGDVVLFVDGLRFDVARSLDGLLRQQGYAVEVSAHWAALPSVTATAKPAVTPVRHLIRGQDVNADFE
ncbi:MAG: PglZ domain-containing protein, partial [Planctomyces sp.]